MAYAAATGTAQMGTMPMQGEPKPSLPSTSLTLIVGEKTTVLSASDLKALPQKTITVHNEHTKKDETYSGVELSELLAKYGLPVEKTTHQQMLHSYIQAQGTDKYWVLYSVVEIEPSEHTGNVLVATAIDGKDLGTDGAFKLVSSEDKKPQRWVRNLMSIKVAAIP